MKTLLTVIFCLTGLIGFGQSSNLYLSADTLRSGNSAYLVKKMDPWGKTVSLFNIQNRLHEVKIQRRDGTPRMGGGLIEPINQGGYDAPISRTFSEEEQKWFSWDKSLKCWLVIDPLKGTILEVRFMFRTDSDWGTLPLSKYVEFEQNLKKYMKFKISENDAQLNYIRILW